MSLWHFLAAIEGFGRANWNLKEQPEDVSDEMLRDLGIEGFT